MKYQGKTDTFFSISKERIWVYKIQRMFLRLKLTKKKKLQSLLWELFEIRDFYNYTLCQLHLPWLHSTMLYLKQNTQTHPHIYTHRFPIHRCTEYWSFRTQGFFSQRFDWILCHSQHSHIHKYTHIVDRHCLEQHHLPLRPLPEDRAILNAWQIGW